MNTVRSSQRDAHPLCNRRAGGAAGAVAGLATDLVGVPPDHAGACPRVPRHRRRSTWIDEQHPGYPWWFAFHQVKGVPEKVFAGRFHIYQDFVMDYILLDSKSIDARDRAVYHAAYAAPDAIRAGDAWYQAFMQDGHYMVEEQPAFVTQALLEFFR